MNPAERDRLEGILASVYEAEAAGRSPDLDALCGGDAALRREVEAALALDEDIDSAFGSLRSTLRADAPGANVGRFRIEATLGEGGTGRVFRAVDPDRGGHVALKVQRVPDQITRLRLQREAEITAAIDHPNIVRVHEVGEADGLAWIAMELFEGTTFGDWAAQRPPREIARAAAAVARALHAAHAQGVVHRDVKPSNILMRGDAPCVADFGLAKTLDAERLTREGIALGTMPYMAPEQLTGDRALMDARTDVYGLGAALYDVVAGQPPFAGDSGDQLLRDILARDPKPLPLVAALRDLDTVVAKALAKEPGHRYATAEEMARDLERFGRGDPVVARRRGLASRGWRQVRRHPRLALAFTSLVALSAGTAASAVQQARRTHAQIRANLSTVTSGLAQRRLADARARLDELRALAPDHTELPRLERELEARQAVERVLDAIHGASALSSLRVESLERDLLTTEAPRRWPHEVAIARILLALRTGDRARTETLLTEITRAPTQALPRATALAQAIVDDGDLAAILEAVPSGGVDDRVATATMLRLVDAPVALRENEVWIARWEAPQHFRIGFEAAHLADHRGNYAEAVEIWQALRGVGYRTDVVDRNLARALTLAEQPERADAVIHSLLEDARPRNASDAAVWIEVALRNRRWDEARHRLERSAHLADPHGDMQFVHALLQVSAWEQQLPGHSEAQTMAVLEDLAHADNRPRYQHYARSMLLELRWRALANRPDWPPSQRPPDDIAAQLGEIDDAAKALIPSVHDHRTRCDLHILRANIALAQLDHASGEAQLYAGIAADPEHPELYVKLLDAMLDQIDRRLQPNPDTALDAVDAWLRLPLGGTRAVTPADRLAVCTNAVVLCREVGGRRRRLQRYAEIGVEHGKAVPDMDPTQTDMLAYLEKILAN